MHDINCPYCDSPQEINHDDGYGYEQDELHQQQCGNCEKYFTFTTSISYYYSVEKADCLNDDKHNFKPTHTAPVECTQMRCTMCGEERKPTEIEMVEILNSRKS